MGSSETIRLSLLGSPRLEGATRADTVLAQQKRLALLAYLAVRHEFVRRDDLVALFWADLEERAGRSALSQGLHFLRRALGPHVLVSRGTEEVGLSKSVWCDAAAFEAALAERRLDDALLLYRGELLQGVNGGVSPEFSFWLDAERMRLHRLAAEAACTRSDQCFRAGDLGNAVQWQRKALELRSTDEVTLRNYLALLDEIGDGGTAVAAYEAFRERLENAFQLEPSPETVKMVEQIRARRPEAPPAPAAARAVMALRNAVSPPPLARPEPQPGSDVSSATPPHWFSRATRLRSRRVAATLVMVAVVAAALVWGQRQVNRAGNAAVVPDPNRVAVTYLEVRGDTTELGYLADGITEAIIDNLGTISNIDVVSQNGVKRFRRKAFEPDSLFSKLNAGSVITGAVSGTRERVLVTLTIETRAKLSLPRIKREFAVGNVIEAINRITEDIVNELGPVLNEAMAYDRMRAGTQNDVAWDHVAKARALLGTFYESIERRLPFEVTYPIAMAADSLLVTAIELDRKWVAPHIMRGEFALGLAWACYHEACDTDQWIANAIEYAEDGKKADPSSSLPFELGGQAYYYRWVYVDGDTLVRDSAKRELTLAAKDQSRVMALKLLSSIYLGSSAFDNADVTAEGAIKADPFHEARGELLFTRFRANLHLRRFARAAEMCRSLTAARGSGTNWWAALCSLELQAWAPDAQPDVQASLRLLKSDFREPQQSWLETMVAAVLAADGQKARAREMIDNAITKARALGDDEVLHFAAVAFMRLRDLHSARERLDEYIAPKPAERDHVRMELWFQELLRPDPNVRPLRDPPR